MDRVVSTAKEMNMLEGPLLKKIWRFSFPIMLSGVLQLLFNAADMVVVGNAVGSTALAAVGATGAMTNLLVALFMGLSIGSGVLVAQLYGARREKDISEAVHTSMLISVFSGIVVGVIGFFASRAILEIMETPASVIDQSTLYIKIYFCGMPAISVYNFGASILRSVGETRRPMVFLIISGILNVFLNLFFVLVIGMGVEGVSLATILSQVLAAFLTVRCLMRSQEECIRLRLRQLRILPVHFVKILKIGLPAGIQSAVFSLSNMLLQSAINSFDDIAMAGNTAAANIDGFVYIALNAFSQAAVTFTGQNVGAGKWHRIVRVLGACVLSVTVLGATLGGIIFIFGRELLGLYDSNPAVIEVGLVRIAWMSISSFLCGIMETLVGMLRGMGRSSLPMIVSIIGVCGVRVVWIFTVFAVWRTMDILYLSYPVTWIATTAVHALCFFVVYKRQLGKLRAAQDADVIRRGAVV